MHDLVRAYAADVAGELPVEVRQAALRRVLSFYVHTSHGAERLLYAHRGPAPIDQPDFGATPAPIPDARRRWPGSRSNIPA